MPKKRTTVTVDEDVFDAIVQKHFEEPEWNFSRWINTLLRENLKAASSPELRKKRLELQLKKSEVEMLEHAGRIESTKKAIASTDTSSMEQERLERKQKTWEAISGEVCRHATRIEGNTEELLAYFEDMMREYPEFNKEIGALYDMKSWRKTAGYVEK